MNSAELPAAGNFIQKKAVWLILGFFMVISLAIAIAAEKWVFLGVLPIPLLIYISIRKPFIFPFGLYVFLLPFEGVLDSSSGTGLSKILGAATILILLLTGTFEKKLKKPHNVVVLWILFVSYASLSLCWAIDRQIVMGKLVTAIGLLLLYLIGVSYQIKKSEFDALKWFIVAGGFVAALLLIKNFIAGEFVNQYQMKASIALGNQETGTDLQAFYLLFPISVGIGLLLEQKTTIARILVLLITFTIIMGVITTGTRGVLLSICVVILVYMLSIKHKIDTGVAVLIIVALVIALIPEHVIEHIGTSADDRGSGRLDIWMVGLKSLQKNWLTGAGFYNFPYAYNEFVDYWPHFRGLSRGPHNIYLKTFVELGIVGFAIMVFTFIRHYHVISFRRGQNNIDQIMLKATFWGMLNQGFFTDILFYKSFWLLWMMMLMYRNAVAEAYCRK